MHNRFKLFGKKILYRGLRWFEYVDVVGVTEVPPNFKGGIVLPNCTVRE